MYEVQEVQLYPFLNSALDESKYFHALANLSQEEELLVPSDGRLDPKSAWTQQ
jgi:hypothetical protein